jgi:hypothetical protein
MNPLDRHLDRRDIVVTALLEDVGLAAGIVPGPRACHSDAPLMGGGRARIGLAGRRRQRVPELRMQARGGLARHLVERWPAPLDEGHELDVRPIPLPCDEELPLLAGRGLDRHGAPSLLGGCGAHRIPNAPAPIPVHIRPFTPVAPLWSAHPSGEAVPVAEGEGEATVPDARLRER